MKSLLRTLRTTSVVGTAALFLTSGPLIAGNSPYKAAPPAAVTVGTCSPNKLKFKVSELFAQTTSSSFVDVPETTLNFTQGGTTPSCVIVAFSAEASASPAIMVLEVVLDGGTLCFPSGNFFVSQAVTLSIHAMNYVCPNVAPGFHSIKMTFASDPEGSVVTLDFRTTIVQFVSP